MSSFNEIFKDEVRRLARKEVKQATDKLYREKVDLKRSISELKQRVAELERENRRVAKTVHQQRVQEVKPPKSEVERARISAKTVRNLRDRLGLTQEEFGQLLGVSGQSVYQWERKDGPLRLRNATKEAVVEAKKLGAREARRRLDGAT